MQGSTPWGGVTKGLGAWSGAGEGQGPVAEVCQNGILAHFTCSLACHIFRGLPIVCCLLPSVVISCPP